MYPADGRKIPDHYAHPYELHDELDAKLGAFPLFKFWGPLTDISATEWIAQATLHVMRTRNPTLTLTYLPHLDYNLQRLGPDVSHPRVQQDLRELDADVVALQEVSARRGGAQDVDQCEHLARAAGMRAVRGPTLRSHQGEIGNALLGTFDKSKVLLVDRP